ncbi:hypothetical protein PAXRUDRAFT_176403, partial [Paxillus rubicundulus Ve08.2h10]
DLGPISWLLMKVTRDQDHCTLSILQELYIKAILVKYNFTDTKPLSMGSKVNEWICYKQ